MPMQVHGEQPLEVSACRLAGRAGNRPRKPRWCASPVLTMLGTLGKIRCLLSKDSLFFTAPWISGWTSAANTWGCHEGLHERLPATCATMPLTCRRPGRQSAQRRGRRGPRGGRRAGRRGAGGCAGGRARGPLAAPGARAGAAAGARRGRCASRRAAARAAGRLTRHPGRAVAPAGTVTQTLTPAGIGVYGWVSRLGCGLRHDAATQATKALQPAVCMQGLLPLAVSAWCTGGCSGTVQRMQQVQMARAPPAWPARLSARGAVWQQQLPEARHAGQTAKHCGQQA